MRIGLIAPPWVPVPPPAYGGTEVVVDNLARALQRRGHEVLLFTVGSSTCPVERLFLYPDAVEPMGDSTYEAAHVLAAYDALADADVDVVHDHTVLGCLVAGARGDRCPPLVVTNHGPFAAEARRIMSVVADRAAVVAISHAQAATAGRVRVGAIIHHGVDLDVYRPAGPGHGYLIFIGRMSPDKGVHRAVRIARRAGRPLRIVTKMRTAEERAYFRDVVAPLLAPEAEAPCELPLAERLALLQGADALLDPIRWPEPFGLVMAEAMAAGVPVLAYPSGAAPEIVRPGLTGFLCADEDAMVAAVGRIDLIDRDLCRTTAERYFGSDRMAAEYEVLYEHAIEGRVATEWFGDQFAARPSLAARAGPSGREHSL